MTKIDDSNNRYELVEPKTYQVPKGFVAVHKNNEKGHSFVKIEDWKRWDEVADSKVKQEELF
jgi:hypothetical protein